MMLSSLALALAASALASPFPNPIHFHPRVHVQDTRVSFKLMNDNNSFRDIRIDGHTYTVDVHQSLNIKAPAGTVVYCEGPAHSHKRGDVLLEVTPAQNNTRIPLD